MTKLKPVIIIGVGILAVLLIAAAVIKMGSKRGYNTNKGLQSNQSSSVQERSTKPNISNAAIFEQNGVTFEHFWPLDSAAQHLKADESEIVVYNRGNQTVEFSSVGMDYFIAGAQMPHYSGTWEKFPDDVSWEKLEYINISPQHYKGEQLSLQPGQKCKIHYHYQVGQGQSQNPDQKIKLNLAFAIAGSPYKLDQELVREQPPRQTSEDEAEHNNPERQESNQGH